MVCPQCNLSYPDTVSRCGCGYDFNLRQVVRTPRTDTEHNRRQAVRPGNGAAPSTQVKTQRPFTVPIFLWIFGVGGVTFVAAALASVEFHSDSNLAPLVVIFAGVGGWVVGLMAWAFTYVLRIPPRAQWWTFAGTCVAMIPWAVYAVIPSPVPKGFAFDAQIQSCEPAVQAADAAIQDWADWLTRSNWHGIDPNWQDQARRRVQVERGVLFNMLVLRKNALAEGRAPWNKGQMLALGWKASNQEAAYYARFARGSCEDYPIGSRSLYFTSYAYDLTQSSGVPGSPWKSLPAFFHRQLLEPLPEEYRTLVGP